MGITGQVRKRAITNITKKTEAVSQWIWRRREENWQKHNQ